MWVFRHPTSFCTSIPQPGKWQSRGMRPRALKEAPIPPRANARRDMGRGPPHCGTKNTRHPRGEWSFTICDSHREDQKPGGSTIAHSKGITRCIGFHLTSKSSGQKNCRNSQCKAPRANRKVECPKNRARRVPSRVFGLVSSAPLSHSRQGFTQVGRAVPCNEPDAPAQLPSVNQTGCAPNGP